MSLFPIPADVALCLEKLQQDFLWRELGEESKLHLFSWDKICLPYQNGGLAVRKLRIFNEVLLGKWLWTLERDSLWRQVVDLKYGSMGAGWCAKPAIGTYGVSLWKFIQQGWIKFSQCTKFEVGDDTIVKFWLDVWHDDSPLKSLFRNYIVLLRIRKLL